MTALLNFGGRKKERKPAKSPKGIQAGQPQSSEAGLGGKAAAKTAQGVFGQIIKPHVTEKATNLATQNQYVFVVQPRAYKEGVARSIEKMYGVNVQGVRMVNVHAKEMLLGRTKGLKKGYKKAIVKVKAGQKIDILPT